MEQVKQTAVEWLADKIKWNWQDIEYGEISMSNLVEQAKEMEKEQHKQTWFESTSQFANESEMLYKKDFEQYYNETYGK